MDNVKEELLRASPVRSSRHGIETRETVLDQFARAKDIITLDADDDSYEQRFTPHPAQQHMSNDFTKPDVDGQVFERRLTANSLAEMDTADPAFLERSSCRKRQLFTSTNARDNMCSISSLPSPPNTNENSPHSSFDTTAFGQAAESDWTLGVCDKDSTEKWDDGLVGTSTEQNSLDITRAKATTDSSALEKARNSIEARGVTKSRQLRAQAQRKPQTIVIERPSTPIDISPTEIHRDDSKSSKQRKLNDGSGQKLSSSLPATHIDDDAAKRRAEERLMRIRTAATQNPWAPKPKSKPIHVRPPLSSAKFYAPDIEGSTQKSKAARPTQSQLSVRELMGTCKLLDTSSSSQVTQQAPTFSILEKLSAGHSARLGQMKQSEKRDIFSILPPQGTDLSLPTNFNGLPDHRRALILKRETLKERERDIVTIIGVFQEFARLLAVSDATENDLKELGEVKRYTEAVLDRDRSGKRARNRIKAIRDNVKRRITKIPEAANSAMVDIKLQEIIQPKYSERMQQELPVLRAELSTAVAECMAFKNKKRKSSTRVSRLFESNSAINESQRAREAHQRSLRIEQMRAQLAKFEKDDSHVSAEGKGEGPTLEIVDPSDDIQDEADSIISEEDTGQDIMQPQGFENGEKSDFTTKVLSSAGMYRLQNEVQDDVQKATQNEVGNEIQKARNAQDIAAAAKVRPSQAVNLSLLERMEANAKQQGHGKQQGVQNRDPQLSQDVRQRELARPLEAPEQEEAPTRDFTETDEDVVNDNNIDELSHEFDDSDLDGTEEDIEEDEDKDNDGQPVCKRYIVKSSITGIGPDVDDTFLELGKYLSKKRAIKSVLAVVPWVKREFSKRHNNVDSNAYSVTLKDAYGEYEQRIELGENGHAGSRTWIEEEMYNPSDEAYEKAKVHKACTAPDLWFVDWERTVEPVQEIAETGHSEATPAATLAATPSATQEGTESDYQESSAAATPVATTRTRPNGDHFRIFTTIALANRHAKDVFMRWFIDQLPGPGNFGYIKQEDESIEEILKSIGDRTTWQRQESFEVKGDDGVLRNDTFKVWVRKASSSGPRN